MLFQKNPSFQNDDDEEGKSPKLGEGFDSDNMVTEPLYRIKDVLDELEGKVLLKYSQELEEVNESDLNIFKLKAGLNKKLSAAF